MTARFLIGDVFDRMADIPDGSVDLVVTSPPFLALRSYLPDGHPDKDKEIGSEATPAEFLDVMLALTAEWGRVLAPHGSIAIEIGDTYSGSGGRGGDYREGGIREGQPGMDGSAAVRRRAAATERQAELLATHVDRSGPEKYTGQRLQDRRRASHNGNKNRDNAEGWPLDKSLSMIPELYAASLAYGRNLLTGEPSPAGRWRVRNFKPWIRSNPPVGALGDKERPATSYVTVATRATDRYFDLDAVRTAHVRDPATISLRHGDNPLVERNHNHDRGEFANSGNPAGAPPLDWWHQVDALIDDELDARAGKANGGVVTTVGQSAASRGITGGDSGNPDKPRAPGASSVGARGVHIRRRLEQAGYVTTVDALDVSPKGYKGAHYAVWPPELVKLLLLEMAPRRVCTTCGQPSRRIVDVDRTYRRPAKLPPSGRNTSRNDGGGGPFNHDETRVTVGWSDCGCPGDDRWRPGHVLDPFAGSGTTLAVAVGLGMDATGVDIDLRNGALAMERVGMWLDVVWPDPDLSLPALPPGGGDYRAWATDQQAEQLLAGVVAALHTGQPRRPAPQARRNGARPVPVLPGQTGLFGDDPLAPDANPG